MAQNQTPIIDSSQIFKPIKEKSKVEKKIMKEIILIEEFNK